LKSLEKGAVVLVVASKLFLARAVQTARGPLRDIGMEYGDERRPDSSVSPHHTITLYQ
jgi:hypothetical protein